MDPRLPYITPFVVAALGILAIAIVVLSHRRVRGGKILFFLCLSAALWSMTEGLLYLGFSKHINIIITKVQYIGIAALPPLALAMVLRVFGLTSDATRITGYILSGIAVLIVIEVWLNDLHHLHFSDYYVIDSGPFPMLGVVHGPLWWPVVVYHYLVILVTTIIIARGLRSPIRIYRGQARVLLVSILVVWAANGIYVAGFSPIDNMDTGPIAFAVVAASFAWGFFRFNMFDIMPAAKEEIFSALQDPVLIVDENGSVVELNRAASELLGIQATNVVGLNIGNALPAFSSLTTAIDKGTPTEIDVGSYWGVKHFEVNISGLNDRSKRRIGKLVIMHDITERKSFENELRQMASTDALTGTSNRRHLFELAGREYSRAKRYGHDLCAVMIDIDGFKRLNDKYGHDVGDEALRRVVKTCNKEIRGSDIFGRIGGEEFVAVLSDQNLDQALNAAERLRSQIANVVVPVSGSETSITASLGVANLIEADKSFNDLLKRADTALYSAKNAGRNCVRIG